MQLLKPIYILLFFAILTESCNISFSFTGASISPDVKTISVQYFPNYAPIVQPILSQELTEALKDKFISQTNLQLVNGIGDLNFEGEITRYNITPIAIQANETSAQNRLTITIRVKFTNAKDSKQNFDTSFSRYNDYPSSESLDAIEEDLIKDIIEQINEDIFNKSVANW